MNGPSDFVVSVIRTYVPIWVGVGVTWLASVGLDLDTGSRTGLVAAATGLVIAVYYLAVRLAGKRWPIVEKYLLGSSRKPEYTEPQA